jgi:alginate O-acetyltransferase complex protein AlgI
MVFSDPVFLFVFLPVVLSLYWAVAFRNRNVYIVIVGIVFYIWSGGALVFLLISTIILNYFASTLIHRNKDRLRSRRILLVAICITTSSLLFWKYLEFFIRQLSGLELISFDGFHVVLPIAISFYTFQCISYVVDVYQGKCLPAPSLVDFSAYILLFPHLIAGPIVRYAGISEELLTPSRRRLDDFVFGIPRFFWGLSKKIIIADQVSVIVHRAFSLPDSDITFTTAWIGAVSFSVQIYFDFSGYSDMAIGLARVFGFTFPENFRRPYSAVSVTDFWRRWHISLSSWFRDYVYIPLGGSRVSAIGVYKNLLIVFVLTGLWHGSNWVFLVWGLFHGFWLIVERLAGIAQPAATKLGRCARRLFTFSIVTFGWVIFRSNDLSQAATFLSSMLHFTTEVPISVREVMTNQRLIMLLIGLSVALLGGTQSIGERLSIRHKGRMDVLKLAVVALIAPIALIYSLTSAFSPFLYFQF